MAVSHRHSRHLVAKDCVKRGEVARVLGEQSGKVVAQIVAAEWDTRAASVLAESSSKICISVSVAVPEHSGRRDVPGATSRRACPETSESGWLASIQESDSQRKRRTEMSWMIDPGPIRDRFTALSPHLNERDRRLLAASGIRRTRCTLICSGVCRLIVRTKCGVPTSPTYRWRKGLCISWR
jgi:hypothetical protein